MSRKQHTPRVRQLLRQAERVSNLDKRLAARQLYEQILEESPETAEAWLGLGKLETDADKQVSYLEKAVAYDPDNEEARQLLYKLTGAEAVAPAPAKEEKDEKEAVKKETVVSAKPKPKPAPPEATVGGTSLGKPAGAPVREPKADVPTNGEQKAASGESDWSAPQQVVQARFDTAVEQPETAPAGEALVCYRHPQTETSLRCNRCGKPICIKCANRTSVGYRCPDCLYELEEKFYTGNNLDYLIALAVSVPLSLIAGAILTLVGFSFWFIFLIFIAGGSVGTLIARLTFRAIGRRRSRYLPEMVAAVVAIGAFVPSLLIFLLTFNIFILILPGIYAFVATGAAYYQLR